MTSDTGEPNRMNPPPWIAVNSLRRRWAPPRWPQRPQPPWRAWSAPRTVFPRARPRRSPWASPASRSLSWGWGLKRTADAIAFLKAW